MTPSRASSRKAFSLLEILVAIVILALLAIIVYPYMARYIENSRSVACASRLRQAGLYYLTYAGDNGGTTLLFRDGATSKMWYNELRKIPGWTSEEAAAHFSCPSFDREGDVGPWWCYGMRLSGSPGRVIRVTNEDGGQTGMYELTLSKVDRPDIFFLMADSITSNPTRQSFRLIPPGLYSNSGIQTRHQDKANVLFLDGHVEALDYQGLANIGITTVIDATGIPRSTEAHP